MAILSPHMRGQKQIITMKIEGLSISNHDLAKSALERISNSLFFQIDIELGVPLTLQREIELSIGRHRRSLRRTEGFKLQFPRTEYNEAPMELYWYAQSAVGMPLLQFLAFYQAIEYYFPIYSRAEALRKVRNILKDPSFRAERDADVGRVLTALSSKGHSGFGDERTQLKAVLLV
jgi:hypothetical protein